MVSCKNLEGVEIKLNFLEYLNISNSNISDESLEYILKESIYLNTLISRNCLELKDPKIISNSLKKLFLNCSDNLKNPCILIIL
jgi:hypothetical protein